MLSVCVSDFPPCTTLTLMALSTTIVSSCLWCCRLQAQVRTKDTHLKRALETISKHKTQIDDLQNELKVPPLPLSSTRHGMVPVGPMSR